MWVRSESARTLFNISPWSAGALTNLNPIEWHSTETGIRSKRCRESGLMENRVRHGLMHASGRLLRVFAVHPATHARYRFFAILCN